MPINTTRKEFVSTNTLNIFSIVLLLIALILYKKDEVILFNVEWWYYFIIFIFSLILVFIILNRPILKRKLIETGYWKYIILISIFYSFFLSITFYYSSKHVVNILAKDRIITENCEILDVKNGRYRKGGGNYYNLKVNFRGKEETIDLSRDLYEKIETIDLKKNHAIIKVKPSIFSIYVVENFSIESNNIRK